MYRNDVAGIPADAAAGELLAAAPRRLFLRSNTHVASLCDAID